MLKLILAAGDNFRLDSDQRDLPSCLCQKGFHDFLMAADRHKEFWSLRLQGHQTVHV